MKYGVAAVLALGAALWATGAAGQKADPAQPYPQRPIRMICPYVPGGGADIFARTVAQKLTESLGQTVVVDNRAGANGGIGTDIVAKSTPDGHTLLLANSGPMTINPVLYRKVAYNPERDFQPISLGAIYFYVLVVLPSFPATTLNEFVAQLKAKPGQMTYGSTGIGGGNHLSGELFSLMTGTKSVHVPYTGSAAALAALLGGQLNYMFDTVITAVPLIRAGRLRAFGVTARNRAISLPDVPTLDSMGLKGFELTQWQAIAAPAGTPRPVVDRLHREIVEALKKPDVMDRLATQGGSDIVGSTPEEFAQVIRNDLAKYAKLVKAAGIQPQ
jgi:tripartite-type tricarboxylate transporter receptor subunit TctC